MRREEDVVEAYKEDKKVFKDISEKEGVAGSISAFYEVLSKRVFDSITIEGLIKRKGLPLALPIGAYVEREKALELIEDEIDLVERRKVREIKRLSSVAFDDLRKNLFKLLMKGDVDHGKRYAKELFLRDSKDFYGDLFRYVAMEDPQSGKGLMAVSMKKLMEDSYREEIFELGMDYIIKKSSDFTLYEKIKRVRLDDKDIKDKVSKRIEGIEEKDGVVEILGYIKVVEELEKVGKEVEDYYRMVDISLDDIRSSNRSKSKEILANYLKG